MSEETKKMVVEIEEETYSVIEEFSAYINEDEDKVVDFLLKEALSEFIDKYKKKKNGYVEMGNINLEISNEFSVSENEALNHIEF